MKKIKVTTRKSTAEVQCHYTTPSGYLAVHKTLIRTDDKHSDNKFTTDNTWTITHIPSGRSIRYNLYMPLPKARELARKMDSPLWKFTDPKDMPQELKEFLMRVLNVSQVKVAL